MKEFFYTDYKQRIYKRILCYKYTAEGEIYALCHHFLMRRR